STCVGFTWDPPAEIQICDGDGDFRYYTRSPVTSTTLDRRDRVASKRRRPSGRRNDRREPDNRELSPPPPPPSSLPRRSSPRHTSSRGKAPPTDADGDITLPDVEETRSVVSAHSSTASLRAGVNNLLLHVDPVLIPNLVKEADLPSLEIGAKPSLPNHREKPRPRSTKAVKSVVTAEAPPVASDVTQAVRAAAAAEPDVAIPSSPPAAPDRATEPVALIASDAVDAATPPTPSLISLSPSASSEPVVAAPSLTSARSNRSQHAEERRTLVLFNTDTNALQVLLVSVPEALHVAATPVVPLLQVTANAVNDTLRFIPAAPTIEKPWRLRATAYNDDGLPSFPSKYPNSRDQRVRYWTAMIALTHPEPDLAQQIRSFGERSPNGRHFSLSFESFDHDEDYVVVPPGQFAEFATRAGLYPADAASLATAEPPLAFSQTLAVSPGTPYGVAEAEHPVANLRFDHDGTLADADVQTLPGGYLAMPQTHDSAHEYALDGELEVASPPHSPFDAGTPPPVFPPPPVSLRTTRSR
ncbi:hypothetical protein HDU96_003854, partial [Phlyctochytrium bullatum]